MAVDRNSFVRPSTEADVEYLSEHMRKEDVEEVVAGGFSPLLALRYGLDNSRPCLTGIDPTTGHPGLMAGSTPCSTFDGFGRVWLLGTPAIEENTITFLRHSKHLLGVLFADYTALYNYTYERNVVHHNWLRWLGFSFLRRVELTPNNHFYEFVKVRNI